MMEMEAAKVLIKKLRGMQGYSGLSEYIKLEMASALAEHCANDDHGERTISAGLKRWTFCPSIPEIIEVAKSLPKLPAATLRRLACSNCGGQGWVIVKRNGIEGAQRCSKCASDEVSCETH